MKRIEHTSGRFRRRTPANQRRWWAGPAACLATLLALPASANIDIPDVPLTTGSRIPANLMFILDNSLSMTTQSGQPGDTMANPDVPQVCRRQANGTCASNTDITDSTYVGNTVYFNPFTDYRTWLTAVEGVRRTGGTTWPNAYSDDSLASGSTTNLSSATRIFYVPKDQTSTSSTYLADANNYYRYEILTNGTVRYGEWGDGVSSSTNATWSPATGLSGSSGAWSNSYQIVVPEGVSSLVINTSGNQTGTARRADLYARHGSQPTSTTDTSYPCRSRNNNNTEACTISNPQNGTWYIRLYGESAYSGVTLTASYTTDNRCSGSGSPTWINCTTLGDTQATALRNNYTTWYSYHRTRMKSAKAGASEAFNRLNGDNIRVGFRVINPSTSGANSNFNIPVNKNQGRFIDSGANQNRTDWYTKLHGATASGSTPLRSALRNTGLYFSDLDPAGASARGGNGPYGPETGTDQLACRRNFAILTTDGWWNQDTGFNHVENADEDMGVPYADSYSNTLADVAAHYWKTDLRPGMRDIVPSSAANPANWQHMVTFGISLGVRGTINPDGPYPGQEGAAVSAWPDPVVSNTSTTIPENIQPRRIDDLLHAAVNSRGKFVAASSPSEFAEGLEAALTRIEEIEGSFSNVAASSTSLDAGSRVFQANYVSGVWTGELRSQPVSVADGVQSVDCSEQNQPSNGWCASKGIPTTGRQVFTSNGHYYRTPVVATTPNQTPRPFPSDATTEQLASLHRPSPASAWVDDVDNAAYIAGARTLELNNTGGRLRNRNHLLGDIIGSSPVFVQDTNTIYIGANDGMLHAIDAANGNELFAYIPGIINWNELGNLSRPDYAHRYFVDGPIVVTTNQQTPDENILVGALGKGGKGLFALDVTSPGAFGEGNNVKWELAETPGFNMGLVQGRPILARIRDGATTQNAVVLGNGVNSASGRAALIVLDLDTGDVIREIAVGATGVSNGLSAPAGVLGPDGRTLSYVYAGDMLGNVWKFDLTDASPDEWTASSLFTAAVGGVAQPISGGLTITTHPVTNQRWVFFGTGRYMTTDDVASTAVQSMYGFVDDGTPIVRSGEGANLTQRTVAVISGTVSDYPVRGFETSTPLPAGSKGWFINLPVSGERIVQDAQVVSSFLITASIIPSGDACESGGRGFINALDAFTGTSAGVSYFDLDGDGSTSDEVVGGRPVGSVSLGGGMPTLPKLFRGYLGAGGTSGSGVPGVPTLSPRWDRASWREIRGD